MAHHAVRGRPVARRDVGLQQLQIVVTRLEAHGREVQRHRQVEREPPRRLRVVVDAPDGLLLRDPVAQEPEVLIAIHGSWAIEVVEHQRMHPHRQRWRRELRQVEEAHSEHRPRALVRAVVDRPHLDARPARVDVLGHERDAIEREVLVDGRHLVRIEEEAERRHRRRARDVGHPRVDRGRDLLVLGARIVGIDHRHPALLVLDEVHPRAAREAAIVGICARDGVEPVDLRAPDLHVPVHPVLLVRDRVHLERIERR